MDDHGILICKNNPYYVLKHFDQIYFQELHGNRMLVKSIRILVGKLKNSSRISIRILVGNAADCGIPMEF